MSSKCTKRCGFGSKCCDFLTQALITGVQIAFPKEGKALKHCLHFIWVFIMYYLEAFENLLLGLIFSLRICLAKIFPGGKVAKLLLFLTKTLRNCCDYGPKACCIVAILGSKKN